MQWVQISNVNQSMFPIPMASMLDFRKLVTVLYVGYLAKRTCDGNVTAPCTSCQQITHTPKLDSVKHATSSVALAGFSDY